jgi:hypothetical protein
MFLLTDPSTNYHLPQTLPDDVLIFLTIVNHFNYFFFTLRTIFLQAICYYKYIRYMLQLHDIIRIPPLLSKAIQNHRLYYYYCYYLVKLDLWKSSCFCSKSINKFKFSSNNKLAKWRSIANLLLPWYLQEPTNTRWLIFCILCKWSVLLSLSLSI